MRSSQALDVRACPICGGHDRSVLFRQRFAPLSSGSLMDGYEVVVCTACGFGFADHLPRQPAFDQYYREMSKYEYQETDGMPTDFERRHFPDVAAAVAGLVPDRRAGVLEIGCANGLLLNELRLTGYESVLGLDPSEVCAETARRLYGARVLRGALSDISAEQGQFDLVIMLEVLEHVRDLTDALSRVRSVLRADGMLFVEVPDATSFARAPDAPFQEFSVEHINYFSPLSLTNLLTGAGFRKILSDQIPVEVTSGKHSTVLRGVFRLEGDGSAIPWARDDATQSGLVAYIEQARAEEERVHDVIAALADRGDAIIVWGVGTHTQRLLATSRLIEVPISAFVDSNPRCQGKRLNGVPVLAPSELIGRGDPILVSSRAFQAAIERQVREDLALPNEVITLYVFA